MDEAARSDKSKPESVAINVENRRRLSANLGVRDVQRPRRLGNQLAQTGDMQPGL